MALGLDSATADRVSMADDKIERIVEGEDVGYVPDSDDENHEDGGQFSILLREGRGEKNNIAFSLFLLIDGSLVVFFQYYILYRMNLAV